MARIPWFETNPNLLNRLKLEISQAYPQLHFSVRNNTAFLSGTFPIMAGSKIIDRFLIEVEFPRKYPSGLPLVYEIGGRIPRTIDRHIYPSEDACLYFPLQLLEVFPKGSSLLDFLNGPVRSFFISQSYYELTGVWLFGEWPHGQDAIYDYYAPILKTQDKAVISRYLKVILRKKIKGHWLCPCGSGKLLRQCHFDEVSKLHSDYLRNYQYAMKQWGWKDRKLKPNDVR